MYRVTYIKMFMLGPQVVTIAHPNLDTAKSIYDAFKIAGVHVRLWGRDDQLIYL